MKDDFERQSYRFVHPAADRWRNVGFLGASAGVVLGIVGALLLVPHVDALGRPALERPDVVDCRSDVAACTARLPDAVLQLPSADTIASESEKRLRRELLAIGPSLPVSQSYLDAAALPTGEARDAILQVAAEALEPRWNEIAHNNRIEPISDPELWSNEIHDIRIAVTEPVELPEAAWSGWAADFARLGAAQESYAYADAVDDLRQTRFREMEGDYRAALDAYKTSVVERRGAVAAITLLGLAFAGFLMALFGRAIARRTRSFELTLDRHTLTVQGERIAMATLDRDGLLALMAHLGRSGHEVEAASDLRRAIEARMHAAHQGEEPRPEERAALRRLLESG